MELFFKEFGSKGNQPLVILHGLFGSSDNWQTFAKYFAEQGLHVIIADQRNHGRSLHSPEMNYKIMADDVWQLIEQQNLFQPIILGHSMGGKTAMQMALNGKSSLNKIIVADIAPRAYPVHHQEIINAIQAIDLQHINSRKQVETILTEQLSSPMLVQFLLKNLYWQTDTQLAWRFNIEAIRNNINQIVAPIVSDNVCQQKALFLRGSRSHYISDNDFEDIKQLFPQSQIVTIENAGHWLHVDAPEEFKHQVLKFIER